MVQIRCGKCGDWQGGIDGDGKQHKLGKDFGTCDLRVRNFEEQDSMGQLRPFFTTHRDGLCHFNGGSRDKSQGAQESRER